MVDSRDVAKKVKKRHNYVVSKVEEILEVCPDLQSNGFLFTRKTIQNRGKESIYYEMNNKAFLLLITNLTGLKSLELKVAIINEHAILDNKLKELIKASNNILIEDPKVITILDNFVNYTKEKFNINLKGETISGISFMFQNYASFKGLSIEGRSLGQKLLIEGIILNSLIKYMKIGEYYKLILEYIYQEVKFYLEHTIGY